MRGKGLGLPVGERGLGVVGAGVEETVVGFGAGGTHAVQTDQQWTAIRGGQTSTNAAVVIVVVGDDVVMEERGVRSVTSKMSMLVEGRGLGLHGRCFAISTGGRQRYRHRHHTTPLLHLIPRSTV